MRKREEGGGRGGLGRDDVADPRGEHSRAWRSRDRHRCGLLGDEVRDEVGKLAVEGDVEFLPPRLLPLLSVHAGVLGVRAPPALLFHLDSSIHGGWGGARISVTSSKYRRLLLQHRGLMRCLRWGWGFRCTQVIGGLPDSLAVGLTARLGRLARWTLTHQQQGGRTAARLLPWRQAGRGVACLKGTETKKVWVQVEGNEVKVEQCAHGQAHLQESEFGGRSTAFIIIVITTSPVLHLLFMSICIPPPGLRLPQSAKLQAERQKGRGHRGSGRE